MKKSYDYLIHYAFDGGTGSLTFEIKNKITSRTQLNTIRTLLEKKNNLRAVAICSYQLIGKVKSQ